MFSTAIKRIIPFTHPVIISKRLLNNQVVCSCATFIIINPEGYILTSAHVLQDFDVFNRDTVERQNFLKELDRIKSNTSLNYKQKNKKLSSLRENQQWIINLSYWWGLDDYRIGGFVFDPIADLALGKIENFNKENVSSFPIFRNPKNELLVGTSLCRIGFPFHTINASYNEKIDKFILAEGVLPLPRFPIEGIHTREVLVKDSKSTRIARFIETSSPGLRGQSGGPIFDVNGHICGLQSRTKSLNLGFSPRIIKGNKEVEENQFLNVGIGTHFEEIIEFLSNNKVSFSTSD